MVILDFAAFCASTLICQLYIQKYSLLSFDELNDYFLLVDWVVTDMMAIRQGVLGRIRYVLKSGLRYLPLYGCYFAQVL